MDFEELPSQENREEKIIELTKAAEGAIGTPTEGEITAENYREHIEQTLLTNVQGLPEELAEELGTIDVSALKQRATELREAISTETNVDKLAELQTEFIYQHIALISNVQNGGDKGFTPAVAREVKGMDCSLSVWSLKERLSDTAKFQKFEFGYPPGHAVAIITNARGERLYVDAQNGLVARVELEQVYDEEVPDTAYPLYEVKSSEPIKGRLPDGSEVYMTRQGGSEYMAKYLGIKEDGVQHTVGNMHMLYNGTSPIYSTEAARQFRETLSIASLDEDLYERGQAGIKKWEQENGEDEEFERYVNDAIGDRLSDAESHKAELEKTTEDFRAFMNRMSGGTVIQDTKFGKLAREHHQRWREQKKQ